MKRTVFIGIFAALILGTVFAQGSSSQGSEKLSLSGILGISRGLITLESGGIVYYTRGLDSFVGFIDGLKAGASVSLEGYSLSRNKEAKEQYLRVTKLSIGGKDYDLAPSLAEGGRVQFSYWRLGDDGLRHTNPRPMGPKTFGHGDCMNKGFDGRGKAPGPAKGPGPGRGPGPGAGRNPSPGGRSSDPGAGKNPSPGGRSSGPERSPGRDPNPRGQEPEDGRSAPRNPR